MLACRLDGVDSLEQDLLARHGPLLSGEALLHALGYTSVDAFRQAKSRGTLPVPTFGLPHRRGVFALTRDVARWLSQHYPASPPAGQGGHP